MAAGKRQRQNKRVPSLLSIPLRLMRDMHRQLLLYPMKLATLLYQLLLMHRFNQVSL